MSSIGDLNDQIDNLSRASTFSSIVTPVEFEFASGGAMPDFSFDFSDPEQHADKFFILINVLNKLIDTMMDVVGSQDDLADAFSRAGEAVKKMGKDASDSVKKTQTITEKAITAMKKKMGSFANSVLSLKSLKKVLDFYDSLAQASAAIQQMNDGLQTTDQLSQLVYQSAQRSRISFSDMATNMKTMSGSGVKFSGNQEALAFTELLTKEMMLAGAADSAIKTQMTSISKAMEDGIISISELSEMLRATPQIADRIASHLGVSTDQVQELAKQSKLTGDILKESLIAAAAETNSAFNDMPMTFAQIGTQIMNMIAAKFGPVLEIFNKIANNPQFTAFAAAIITVLSGLAMAIAMAAQLISDNWSILAPVILGVAAALMVYNGAAILAKVNTVALAAAKVAMIAVNAIMTLAQQVATAAMAIFGATTAAATLPLQALVITIILLVGMFYGAIAAINHFAGTSLSATGLIMGAFSALGAFIVNIVLGVINYFIGGFIEVWNLIGSFANFFANVFNDPVGAILKLFADMFDFILGIVQSAAKLIDTVLGSDLSGAVAGFRSMVADKVDDIVGEQEVVFEKLDPADYQFEGFDYGEAFDSGYSLGSGIEDSLKGFFTGGLMDFGNFDSLLSGADLMEEMAQNSTDTAGNTGKIAGNTGSAAEELKYLRDIAEREAINRFTTAEIKVDMSNTFGNIGGIKDIDGMFDALGQKFEERLFVVAEEVHI